MEINKIIEALEKQGYKIEAPQKKEVVWSYQVYHYTDYVFVNDQNETDVAIWESKSFDYARYRQSNVFNSQEEAEQQVKLNELTAKYLELIRRTNEKAGLVIDWESAKQLKMSYCWNHNNNELDYLQEEKYQYCSNPWYWLIPQSEAIEIMDNHFTDTELKAIITQDRSLL